MQLNIAFSPCPNDTFIFDALVHQKIDTEGLQFNVLLEDVQTLNQWAIEGKVSITKLSYGVLPLVTSQYNLLNSGSALGKGVGPLLISLPNMNGNDLNQMQVAIPGENTTAHLLFSLEYPQITRKVFLRYDEIENFVLSGEGLGVIIHENRFTYAAKGLHKITDLGDYWETTTGAAIPLGGIVIKKDVDEAIQQKIDRLIKKSIEYAYTQYPQLNDYIRCHAQEMSEAVMRQHIDLYVNDYSLQLGEEGKKAIHTLMNVYAQLHPGFNANQLQYVKTVHEG
ncbi:MAG: 1,4-dihydroxy-6-naphthoate synthase [Ferruginibacter sp.]